MCQVRRAYARAFQSGISSSTSLGRQKNSVVVLPRLSYKSLLSVQFPPSRPLDMIYLTWSRQRVNVSPIVAPSCGKHITCHNSIIEGVINPLHVPQAWSSRPITHGQSLVVRGMTIGLINTHCLIISYYTWATSEPGCGGPGARGKQGKYRPGCKYIVNALMFLIAGATHRLCYGCV